MYLGSVVEQGPVNEILKILFILIQGLLNALPDINFRCSTNRYSIPSPLDRPSGCYLEQDAPMLLKMVKKQILKWD